MSSAQIPLLKHEGQTPFGDAGTEANEITNSSMPCQRNLDGVRENVFDLSGRKILELIIFKKKTTESGKIFSLKNTLAAETHLHRKPEVVAIGESPIK